MSVVHVTVTTLDHKEHAIVRLARLAHVFLGTHDVRWSRGHRRAIAMLHGLNHARFLYAQARRS